jgi:hypothetical protein
MKQLQTKLVFVMFFIFLVGWSICALSIWSLEFGNARKDVIRTGELLLDTAAAVRSHTANELGPLFSGFYKSLSTGKGTLEFNKNTVPSYVAQEILGELQESKHGKGYRYRETAINPTSRKDLPEPWELELINYFVSNPEAPPRIGTRFDEMINQKTYYVATPVQIKKPSCLVCHSSPDKAPASLISTYGSENGFGWKLNEVVGARIISVPASVQYSEAWKSAASYLLAMASIFLVAYTATLFIVYRWVTKPLDLVTQLLEEVSLHQVEGARLPEDSSSPLYQLNRAINRLLISLYKTLGSSWDHLSSSQDSHLIK